MLLIHDSPYHHLVARASWSCLAQPAWITSGETDVLAWRGRQRAYVADPKSARSARTYPDLESPAEAERHQRDPASRRLQLLVQQLAIRVGLGQQ